MQTLNSFKQSVTIYQFIWCNTAEDSNLLFLNSLNWLSHITAIINTFRETLAYDIGVLRKQKKKQIQTPTFFRDIYIYIYIYI